MLTIGIDLGGTYIKGTLFDTATLEAIRSETKETIAWEGPAAVIGRIAEIASTLRDASGGQAKSVGIGVPGLYIPATGCTTFLPNLPTQWKDVPLGPEVQKAVGLPAVLINDARAFVLAEARIGAGTGRDRVVGMTLGTGVGGGVVIGGKLLFGHDGSAGEVGHQIIEMHGERCGCGSRGCLEAYATGSAIAARAMRAVLQGQSTLLRDLCTIPEEGGKRVDLNRMTPETVAQAADAGDGVARVILEDVSFRVGIGVANLITLFSPDVVIIGGGVARAIERWLYPIVDRTKRERCRVTPIQRVHIRRPKLASEAGAIGAALWAAEHAQQGPSPK